ncbi:MAG TPA: dihydroorotate dehydrogenase [Oscillospiraceae bacterium]|nr:dihydroorotate dehydrogenase [Oscillospiraceae bacterium]HPS35538.1 dihydroorotate dehydrogenase [Oscillospiraceae bacterium]
MVDMRVNVAGLRLDNPIIPASGVFGFGADFAQLYDLNILGSIAFKGTTKEPRFGNPEPRIAECPAGMLNAVGLQNPGIEKVITEELPKLFSVYKKPVIANVSGFSIDEYVYCCKALDAVEQVEILEVNISCPNVHGGGIAFGTDPKSAAAVTKAVKAVAKKPVFIKLSPNVTDITEIAKAVEAEGADGVSLINTLLGMRIDLNRRKPILANVTGGYSGPGVFPVAVQMVYQVYKAVKIPIMGMGGIASAEDVIEMMLAGAAAVQIGSANLVDPFICRKIIADLPSVMEKYRIERLSELTGGAHL